MKKNFLNKKAQEFSISGIMVLIASILISGVLAVALLCLAGNQCGGGSIAGDQLVVNLHNHRPPDKHDDVTIYSNVARQPKEFFKYGEDVHFDVMTAGDLNGDGIDEIIVGTELDAIKVVYPEQYDILHEDHDIYPAITAGDFDGDGKDEIAYVRYDVGGADEIKILSGVSKYGYTKNNVNLVIRCNHLTDGGCYIVALAAGDFDGDGKDDLAIGHNSGEIDIFTGISEFKYGNYRQIEKFVVNNNPNNGNDPYPNTMVAGNFSGKNHDGLALITNDDDILWLNDDPATGGAFRNVHHYDCDMNGLTAADFNNDGKDDTVATCKTAKDAWLITQMDKPNPTPKKIIDFKTEAFPIASGKFT